MLAKNEIIETINMISDQNLDVRTITLSLSLMDCISDSKDVVAKKVYDKVATKAERLAAVGEQLTREYGIPIINKRVAVSPVSIVGAASGGYEQIAFALDRAAQNLGIDFIGGYTALINKGITDFEAQFLQTIPSVLHSTKRLCSSVSVGTSKSGINMDAVRLMGKTIKELSILSADNNGFDCAKIVVFCNPVEDNPFMAGAFCGLGEGDAVINVGVSGPGVVEHALKGHENASIGELAETIKKTAFKITRAGQLIGREAAKRLNASFGIVDLSLAPTPKAGDSVAYILQSMGLQSVGAAGTTACLAILNDAIKKGGLMACSSVGGLSGAFIPVSEDAGMIQAAKIGALSLEKLEAMTAVCSVGLDMIALEGDISASTISGIIADECAIGMVNNKTTAVRVIPVPNKKVGDVVEFGGLFGSAPIMKASPFSCEAFINRGGTIPSPLHSNKN